MHRKPFTANDTVARFIRHVLLFSSCAGAIGGLILAHIYAFSPMTSVLMGVGTASLSACLCATMLRRMTWQQPAYQPRSDIPKLESRMRFGRVFGVHMLKKNHKKQPTTFADVIAAHIQPAPQQTEDDGDFRPATIVYENMGGYSNSDTYSREQGVATARIALLSMDHTKQIPH
ncbi:MAG: hypothetical protein EBV03_08320 [Proteobacteria bacterium]|nr:hypothetical protein [Pseudomonadota bacterium]